MSTVDEGERLVESRNTPAYRLHQNSLAEVWVQKIYKKCIIIIVPNNVTIYQQSLLHYRLL